jgi:hypothetical protein
MLLRRAPAAAPGQGGELPYRVRVRDGFSAVPGASAGADAAGLPEPRNGESRAGKQALERIGAEESPAYLRSGRGDFGVTKRLGKFRGLLEFFFSSIFS